MSNILGTIGADILSGTETGDTIEGHGAADVILGGAGDDTLLGDNGPIQSIEHQMQDEAGIPGTGSGSLDYTTVSATEAANVLTGGFVTVTSAQLIGAAEQIAAYGNGNAASPGLTPSDSGLIISTGAANQATSGSDADRNTSSSMSTVYNAEGDAGLDDFNTPGMALYDAAGIEFTFVAPADMTEVRMVLNFASEEFPEYVNAGFSDVAGVFVNGVLVPIDNTTKGVIDVDSGAALPGQYTENHHSNDVLNTEFDGVVSDMSVTIPLVPGESTTLRIVIADEGDGWYDSALLLAAGAIRFEEHLPGDDTLAGEKGNDYIDGQEGDDALYGGSNPVDGATGTKSYYLEDGTRVDAEGNILAPDDDTILGGVGNDMIFGAAGHDSLVGGEGDDEITGGSGLDILFGDTGRDTLYGGGNDDQLLGGFNEDLLEGGAGDDMLEGGHGADTLVGGSGDDVLNGGSSNDFMRGGTGNDTLDGGDQNDEMTGGKGDDLMLGGAGDDLMSGHSGNDTLLGGSGNDTLNGGNGDDEIDGVSGNNVLNGGSGNDTIRTGDGQNTVDAGSGSDIVIGGAAKDSIKSGSGNDTVEAGDGNDYISAHTGNDVIDAGAGNDKIVAGRGSDTISGGEGADTFVFRSKDMLTGDANVITDFTVGAVDADILDLRSAGLTDTGETFDVWFADHVSYTNGAATVDMGAASLTLLDQNSDESAYMTGLQDAIWI